MIDSSYENPPRRPPEYKLSSRHGTLIKLFWLAVGVGLLFYLTFALRAAREAARCQQCANNLKQLSLGLRNFDSSEGSLPPAFLCDEQGASIHSWHAVVMAYIGYYSWRKNYHINEPWDGPNNRLTHQYAGSVFRCPTAGDHSRLTVDYVAVVGPDTMWPGLSRVKLPQEGQAGNDTILLIELPGSDYRCLEPRAPTVEEFMERIALPSGKGIRTIHPKGLAYVTVGGEVGWFPRDTDPETIRQRLRRDPSLELIGPEVKLPIVENWGKDLDDGR